MWLKLACGVVAYSCFTLLAPAVPQEDVNAAIVNESERLMFTGVFCAAATLGSWLPALLITILDHRGLLAQNRINGVKMAPPDLVGSLISPKGTQSLTKGL